MWAIQSTGKRYGLSWFSIILSSLFSSFPRQLHVFIFMRNVRASGKPRLEMFHKKHARSRGGASAAAFETCPGKKVSAARPFLIFGQPAAKIAAYTRRVRKITFPPASAGNTTTLRTLKCQRSSNCSDDDARRNPEDCLLRQDARGTHVPYFRKKIINA